MTQESRTSHGSGEPEVVTSIRLTRRQMNKLKLIAERENRSVSQQLRHVIDGLASPEQTREAA